MTGFIRDPGPLNLSGYRVEALQPFAEYLGSLGYAGVIASDLSLGAWRSHQIASEFCSQLMLRGPSLGEPEPALPPQHSALARSKVGRLIDSETWGDRITLEALRLATEVSAALAQHDPTICCVFAPRFGFSWEPGDTRFFRFLSQALRGTSHSLMLVSVDRHDPALPDDWRVTWSSCSVETPVIATGGSLAALVPGILTPELARALKVAGEDVATSLELPGHHRLVAPELRRDPNSVPRKRFTRLASIANDVNWLNGYAECFGEDLAGNAGALWERARDEFAAGGFGIAIRLLSRAMELSRSVAERAVFLLLLQGARISSERFAEAAEISDPATELSAPMRGWLFHTKGWALTMVNRSVEAEACLQQARVLLRDVGDSEEYLYLLNISALNQLKLGDLNQALRIERNIRSTLQHIESGRWQLRYINSLNLARLNKRKGDFERSEQFYRTAFGTSYGIRSDSDNLYLNVCCARLDEARGRPADAFLSWARASLFWLASTAPEAIGRRVTGAILASEEEAEGNLIDDVTCALIRSLLRSAADAGLHGEVLAMHNANPALAPAFADSKDVSSELLCSVPWHAICGPGGWVLVSAANITPIISSSANLRLRSAIGALLRMDNANVPMRTVVVDHQLGRALPATLTEILGIALRLELTAVMLAGRRIDLGALRDYVEQRFRISICTAVDHVIVERDMAIVTFKRYRDFKQVTGPACRLLGLIRDSDKSLRELRSKLPDIFLDGDISCLRMLERERIVDLFPPALSTFDLVTD